MRRALLVVAWAAACALASCGPSARPCLEDEECFGGEYCAAAGVCAVYDGRRRVGSVPGADAGQVRAPDAGNPFTPNEPTPDAGRPDAAAPVEDAGDEGAPDA